MLAERVDTTKLLMKDKDKLSREAFYPSRPMGPNILLHFFKDVFGRKPLSKIF